MSATSPCRNISTDPPSLRPLVLPRPPMLRRRRSRRVPLGQRIRQAPVRVGAGVVAGMFYGCLTGMLLGAGCGLLYLFLAFLPGSIWNDWEAPLGLLAFCFTAALIGAAVGVLPGLFVGGMVGAAAALLRGGLPALAVGLLLGPALSPLLLSGHPWEEPTATILIRVAGALGGLWVARVVGSDTRHLA
jgi:hypothetical protein